MKCIKEKCKYCEPDMFKASVLECTLSNNFCKFKRTADIDCVIDEMIEYNEQRLKNLKEYRLFIARI